MVSYLTDTDKVEAYDGTNWLEIGGSSGGGKVVQIVTGTTTTGVNNSTSTYVDTGLTATITPTSASNKVLVLMNQNGCGKKTNNTVLLLRLMRGATVISSPTLIGGFNNGVADNFFNNARVSFLDETATTSATTYKTQVASSIEMINEVKTVRKLRSTFVDTFDIISIQLYESYSHIDYNVTAAPDSSR
jgi:hypothetical protein